MDQSLLASSEALVSVASDLSEEEQTRFFPVLNAILDRVVEGKIAHGDIAQVIEQCQASLEDETATSQESRENIR